MGRVSVRRLRERAVDRTHCAEDLVNKVYVVEVAFSVFGEERVSSVSSFGAARQPVQDGWDASTIAMNETHGVTLTPCSSSSTSASDNFSPKLVRT